MLGGIIAGLLYELVFASDASISKAKLFLLSADSRRQAAASAADVTNAATSMTDVELQLVSADDEKQRLKVVEIEASL